MVNENNNINLIVKENYKKVEEVREIENKIPTYEEFMKSYENDGKVNYDDLRSSDIGSSKGYGPCPDIWNESNSAHKSNNGFEALSVSTKGRVESGANERIYASAGADFSGFRYRDGFGDLKLGNYSASAEAGIGESGASAKYKLGVDVVNLKVGGATR